jgi:hypothetical protein
MPIISNVELFYAKLDPKRPNNKFDKKNPTWELQIRTTNKDVKKSWEAMNLKVKAIVPDEEGVAPYYRVNLRKKTIKNDQEKASPVKVVNGAMEDIDPNSIGNGSVGNVRIFQYEYPLEGSPKPGIATVLMGVQVTKHIVFKSKPRDDDFAETETEVIEPAEEFETNDTPAL